jgi:hypothetical protein
MTGSQSTQSGPDDKQKDKSNGPEEEYEGDEPPLLITSSSSEIVQGPSGASTRASSQHNNHVDHWSPRPTPTAESYRTNPVHVRRQGYMLPRASAPFQQDGTIAQDTTVTGEGRIFIRRTKGELKRMGVLKRDI